MIYTSYFANLKSLPSNVVPVAICGKKPDWYEGLHYPTLAPKYDFFKEWKQNQDDAYYTKCYQEQVLDNLCFVRVMQELQQLTGDKKDICLVCYEAPDKFCHRHLVSKWLQEQGILASEWNAN